MADYGQNFYDSQYQDYDAIYDAARLGSQQAQFYGNEAAKVADPYGYERRNKAADAFDRLLKNPGGINTSPVYKYLMKEQLNPVKAYNAAHGLNNSGRGMLALQKAAKEASTEAFFPLLTAYGKASGAFNPLSPAAASLALRGSERSMDSDAIAAAARAAGNSAPPPTIPWWMQGTSSFGSGSLPSGGAPGTYTPGQIAGAGGMGPSYYDPNRDPYIQDVMNTYYPSFGGVTSPTYGASDPGAMAEQNYWGYE